MTIGETVKGFRGWLDYTGHTSAQTNWSAQYLYGHMLKVRASYISQKLRAGIEVGYENFKVIPCLKLIKADRNECPCIPSRGCYFRKTEIPVIRHIHISYVGTSQGEIKYDYLPWENFEDQLNHRYADIANSPYYTFKNIGDRHHHYVLNDIHKRTLTETLIPYDPIEYALMPDCNGKVNHCLNAFDVEFIMDSDLEKVMFDETYKSLVAPRPKDTDVFNNGIKDIPGLSLK